MALFIFEKRLYHMLEMWMPTFCSQEQKSAGQQLHLSTHGGVFAVVQLEGLETVRTCDHDMNIYSIQTTKKGCIPTQRLQSSSVNTFVNHLRMFSRGLVSVYAKRWQCQTARIQLSRLTNMQMQPLCVSI